MVIFHSYVSLPEGNSVQTHVTTRASNQPVFPVESTQHWIAGVAGSICWSCFFFFVNHQTQRKHPLIINRSQRSDPASCDLGMDQYLLIPFLGGWTSIYQLFWCSPGVQGFDTLPFDNHIWVCLTIWVPHGTPKSSAENFHLDSFGGIPLYNLLSDNPKSS